MYIDGAREVFVMHIHQLPKLYLGLNQILCVVSNQNNQLVLLLLFVFRTMRAVI